MRSYIGATPQACATCRYRKTIEHDSPAIMTGLTSEHCEIFVCKDGPSGKTSSLLCAEAYDKFCGGASYRPNFWAKVRNLSPFDAFATGIHLSFLVGSATLLFFGELAATSLPLLLLAFVANLLAVVARLL